MKKKKRTVEGMEFILYHDFLKPKVVYCKVPNEPSFSDFFNHPCQEWLDKGYFINNVIYHYNVTC